VTVGAVLGVLGLLAHGLVNYFLRHPVNGIATGLLLGLALGAARRPEDGEVDTKLDSARAARGRATASAGSEAKSAESPHARRPRKKGGFAAWSEGARAPSLD
jgi:hypothetical protein